MIRLFLNRNVVLRASMMSRFHRLHATSLTVLLLSTFLRSFSKKKRQRHYFPTRTTVVAFPTACPPLAFSSAVATRYGLLQRWGASPQARYPPDRCCRLHHKCHSPRAPHAPYHEGGTVAHRGPRNPPPRPVAAFSTGVASSTPLNFTRRRASIPKQQGDVALKAHVANIYFRCFIYFRGMLQVFRIGLTKVDQDVAHITIAMQVCFKCTPSVPK
jgi:hypothetical protein